MKVVRGRDYAYKYEIYKYTDGDKEMKGPEDGSEQKVQRKKERGSHLFGEVL